MSVYVRQHAVEGTFSRGESWVVLSEIEKSIKRKIEAVGKPLGEWDISINYGIKTGCNDAFIIDGATRDRLIAEDPKSAELIRPILRGRDIKRYGYTFADQWIIATHNGYKTNEGTIPPVDITRYPAIKRHLDQYWGAISKRNDRGVTPYNLRNCAYMDDLDEQKIVWGEISDTPKFAIDLEGKFSPEATVFMMTGNHLEYLLCYLNSSYSEYFFAKYGTTTGMGTLRWKKYLVELLPIPPVSNDDETLLKTLLDSLLIGNQSFICSEIDKLIFDRVGLSEEERNFIIASNRFGSH